MSARIQCSEIFFLLETQRHHICFICVLCSTCWPEQLQGHWSTPSCSPSTLSRPECKHCHILDSRQARATLCSLFQTAFFKQIAGEIHSTPVLACEKSMNKMKWLSWAILRFNRSVLSLCCCQTKGN